MTKKSYLERYYRKHNPLSDRLTINRRLFFKSMIFTVTAAVYFILRALDVHNFFNPASGNLLSGYIQTIIFISMVISLISIIISVIVVLKPRFLNRPFFQVYYNQKRWFYNILDWVSIVPVCAVLAMFINIYLFSFNKVEGTSMVPTLYDGETVALFPSATPERFDVIVIDVRPEHYQFVRPFQELYIKRLIGLPGDQIEYRADEVNVVNINGVPYQESFFSEPVPTEPFGDHCLAMSDRYDVETTAFCSQVLNGVATVPEGHYLAIGDNRSNSSDSRTIGFIRAEDLIGVVRYKINALGDWEKL